MGIAFGYWFTAVQRGKHRNSHWPLTLARQPPILPRNCAGDRDHVPADGTGNLHFD